MRTVMVRASRHLTAHFSTILLLAHVCFFVHNESIVSRQTETRGIAVVVFIQNTQSKDILIGYSSNPKKRLADLQKSSSSPLVLLGAIYGDQEDKVFLHQRFAHSHVKGDWFK